MRRTLVLVSLFAALAGGVGCGAAPTPGTTVAVVDMQRALRECAEGRTASEQLRALYASRQADLDRRQTQLQQEQVGINAAQGQGQNVTARMATFQQELAALQREFQSFQQELNDAEQHATAQILERLGTALRNLVVARGIDVVVEKSSVSATGPRAVDLTADLIHAYDTRSPAAH